ncbi:MAG: nicotinate phosphoribosyltransferase [Traorella sp.]
MESFDAKFDFRDERNLSLVMDLYELTMSQCYFNDVDRDCEVTFDLFYRKNPDDGGFSIFCGLEQMIGYIQNLHFEDADIDYLRSTHLFSEDFLDYLRHFIFTGDIYAIKEGSIVFPNEPLVRVKAKMIEAQLIETALLLAINHQTLIATKAHRVKLAAQGRAVMEFGARRAHNFDAAYYGSRAAYIGGVDSTATVFAGQKFDIPVVGTMAHSFVQSFDSEYEAFLTYAKTYPDSCVVLLDTYDVINSGLVNAIRLEKEYLKPLGYHLKGVRIDSGDIAYLSTQIRKILDENDMPNCKIVASNSLDEYLIKSLIEQGAQIDSFGVGENLIVSKSSPVFGGVYKLSSIIKNGKMIPKIKLSENIEKMTNPGFKDLYRVYDKNTKMMRADVMAVHGEVIDEKKDLTIYHPNNMWQNKTFKANEYYLEELLQPIFVRGLLVYDVPSIEKVRNHCQHQFDQLWPQYQRFEYPHVYKVSLTSKLLEIKSELIKELKK